jgi:iron complex transport system substrate-binding protein
MSNTHLMLACASRQVSTIKASLLALLFVCSWMPGLLSAQNLPATDAVLSVVDDTGVVVTLAHPATRIISLAPSMTELLFSLGAGERILGVMDYSDYPAQALQIPVVGRFDMLDMEQIVALQPDLVVAWLTGNPRNAIQRLKDLGIAVYTAEPDSMLSISEHLLRLGELTGQGGQAENLSQQLLSQLATIAANEDANPPVRVFYQVWHSPIISVGGTELINDMINRCGGSNIFAELPVGPRVNLEDVLLRDPEVIIASGSDRESPAWLNDWLRWPEMSAVRNQHLYAIEPDLVQRHSLRALQGLQQMCEFIDRARP